MLFKIDTRKRVKKQKTSTGDLDETLNHCCSGDAYSPVSREDDTPHTVRFRHCTEAASSAVAHCYDLTGGVRACRINVCSKQRKVEEKRKQRGGGRNGRGGEQEGAAGWSEDWRCTNITLHLPQRPCQCDAMPEWLMGKSRAWKNKHTHKLYMTTV